MRRFLVGLACFYLGWAGNAFAQKPTPPKVVGPLSPANEFVIVENHEPGTILRVIANDATTIGTQVNSRGGRDSVPLTSPLIAGMSLRAVQQDPSSGAESDPSPDAVIVLDIPTPPGQPKFRGTIYSCVSFVRVTGLAPGASVEIHQPAGNLIGESQTYNGPAEIRLNTPVNANAPLVIRQQVGGTGTTSQYPMPIMPVPMEGSRKLRMLKVVEALDCGWDVVVEGTINGVETTITRIRNGSETMFHGYGLDNRTTFWLGSSFERNDLVSALQRMAERCDVSPSSPSPKLEVPLRQIHPPLIVPPVCPDANRVELLNIETGADYEIYARTATGSEVKEQLIAKGRFPKKDPESWVYISPIESVPGAASELMVRQTACGWTSEFSPAVQLERLGSPQNPSLPDTLYACAGFVRVTGVAPGSWVSIHSLKHGGDVGSRPLAGRIGLAHSRENRVSVPVSPRLNAGDIVWACATGCGASVARSQPTPVLQWEGLLSAEVVEPVYPSDTTIHARELVTGADVFVEVFGPQHANGRELFTSVAWAPETEIGVGKLYEGDRITVFQNLCDSNASRNRGPTAVVKLGTLDVTLSPTSVTLGDTATILATATDPARQSLVDGNVIIAGKQAGKANGKFAWTAPTSGTSVPVAVVADGYTTFNGAITLKPRPWTGSSGAPSFGASGSSGGSKKKPKYNVTLKKYENHQLTLEVEGWDFPTTSGSSVTLQVKFDGLYKAFGQTYPCSKRYNGQDKFGPLFIDANGKFKKEIALPFECVPCCGVTIEVASNKVGAGGIDHPKSYVKCQGACNP